MDNFNALSFHVNSVACQMLKSNLNGSYLAFFHSNVVYTENKVMN